MSESDSLAAFDSEPWLALAEEVAHAPSVDAALSRICEAVVASGPYARAVFVSLQSHGLAFGSAGYSEEEAQAVRIALAKFTAQARATNRARALEQHRLVEDLPIIFIPEGVREGLPPYVIPGGPAHRGEGGWHEGDELVLLPDGPEGRSLGTLGLTAPRHGRRPQESDLTWLRALTPWFSMLAAIVDAREQATQAGRGESRRVLQYVEALATTNQTDELLDRLAELCARIAGYRTGLLTVHLDDGPHLGAWNVSAKARAGFAESMHRTTRSRAHRSRAAMREHLFPGTDIAYVPRSSSLRRGSGFIPTENAEPGTWDPEDRLFVLMVSANGQDMGVLSLDGPLDGNAPRIESLGPLRLAAQFLRLGATLLEARVMSAHLVRAHRLESLGTLAAGAAHDFNNIVGVIMGYGSLLTMISEDQPALAQIATSIQEASARAAELTSRLRALARVDQTPRSVFDPRAVLEDLAAFLRETYDARLTVQVHAETEGPWVHGDASQLYRALMNLCLNAREAMDGEGTLSLILEREAPPAVLAEAHDGPWIRIRVEDTGPGIDETLRDRVLEPFFSTKPRDRASGMGLFLSWGVVKAHGGTLTLADRVGGGASVHVTLPAVDRRSVELPPEADVVPVREGGPVVPAHVLVVEDEPMLQDLLRTGLEMLGHTVEVAGDGEAALAALGTENGRYDLLILDLVLPLLSGLDVIRHLRAHDLRLPTLVSSGNVQEGFGDSPLRARVDAVLTKPWRLDDLQAHVQALLREHPERVARPGGEADQ